MGCCLARDQVGCRACQAGVAQLAAQPPCKRQVVGSSPTASSTKHELRAGFLDFSYLAVQKRSMSLSTAEGAQDDEGPARL